MHVQVHSDRGQARAVGAMALAAAKLPVVHTVQLLDWAYGGKKPVGVPEGRAREAAE